MAAHCYQNHANVYNSKTVLKPLTLAQLYKYDGVNVNHKTRLKLFADIFKTIELNPKLATGYLVRALNYAAEKIQ